MLQPGDRIGRYEIQRRLGRGGMGTVYVAHDPVLGRLVAIKLFAGDLDAADAAAKFAREARAAAALNHANIVTVHDFGEFESQPFIVMEYIQGETVARLIRKKAELSLSDRLRMLEELCAGVAYAHGFEVIHRDIKPANLILDRANRLKILDFGIARILGTSMSKATAMIGTPGYMAPEQIRGGVTDPRSDLFAIGAVAYELLSYGEAFPGESIAAITHRILSDEPTPLAELVVDIPPDLVTIVERALRKDPSDRYPDAATLGRAMADVRREIDGDPRYRTLVRMQPYPEPGVAEPGTGRESDARRQPSGSGRTTSVDQAGRREDLMRRRTEKIAAAVARAGALLEEGRVEEAHEACLEALTLDETNPEALQLEVDISAGRIRRRVTELAAAGEAAVSRGALADGEDLLRQIRMLDARAPEARSLERALRARRNEQAVATEIAESFRLAIGRAATALEAGDADAAWTAARQALRLVPDSEEAARVEREAQRRIDAETGVADTVVLTSRQEAVAPTIVVPSGRTPRSTVAPPPLPEAPSGSRAAAVAVPSAGGARTIATALTQTLSAWGGSAWRVIAEWCRLFGRRVRELTASIAQPGRSPRLSRALLAWTAAGAALAIIVSALVFLKASPLPAQPAYGTVSVDALPWARVEDIVRTDGTRQPIPDDASTPLSLRLPPGEYRITLAGPSADSETRELPVTVTGGQDVRLDGGRFSTPTVEEYFEPYLLVDHASANSPEESR